MLDLDPSNKIFETATSFINQTNRDLFLTGKAGTGKTTFLKYIKEHSYKKLVVVAPTGVAAINAGGVTIHSFFQIPPGTFLPSNQRMFESFDGSIHTKHTLFKNMRMSAEKRDLLRELDLLIIDEVSMVRADLLDAMDLVLRHFRNQPLVPFGGVQVLYIGDLFQLPPVVKVEEWELLKEFYRSPFFFDAEVMQQRQPVYIELKKIYRQKDDLFINILNNIRKNCCTTDDLARLHQNFRPGFSPASEENFIVLTTHNNKADHINNRELNKLPAKAHRFHAEVTGEFNERSFPADNILQLKEGAQVMFIKNDTGESRKFFNGKIGTIHSIDSGKIKVSFPGEEGLLDLAKETWKSIRYHYKKENDEIEEEELGTFMQYPIRLAWAITIHKSQGLTFEKAVIDAGASFAAGQVYVALSRLTGLEGLILHSKIYQHCIQTDERVLEFERFEMPDDELQKALITEQQNFIQNSLMQGFGWQKLIDILIQHSESYEHRKLADVQACAAWAGKLIKAAEELHQTGTKFQKQLEQLFDEAEKDNYKHLHDRVSSACHYFIKVIDEGLIFSLNEHIDQIKTREKAKKYLRDLYELKRRVEHRRQQFQNMLKIAVAMQRGSNGSEVLAAVEHLHRPAEGLLLEDPFQKKKKIKGETQRTSLQMFQEGKSMLQIAKERNLSFGTIEGHLAGFVATGEVDIASLLNQPKLEKILKVLERDPETPSSVIRQILGDTFSYGQIKAATNHFLRKISLIQADFTD